METNFREWIPLLMRIPMFKCHRWETKKCCYNFKVILYFKKPARQKAFFFNCIAFLTKDHATKEHLQELSDEWFINSCYYKRVFPKKGLRKWQRVCSWIGWFRILPGKGEHQATNYSTASNQIRYSKETQPIFNFNRVVNFQKQNSLVLTINSTF